MSKLQIGNGQFLEEIDPIPLNSNFGTKLDDAVKAINNNFKRLISVPFLKGSPGESLELKNLSMFNGTNLTRLGKAIEMAIYGTDSYNSFSPSIDNAFGGSISSVHSYDSIDSSKDIKVAFYSYRDRDTNTEFLYLTSQQLFIFIDSRIGSVEDISTDQLTTFKDLSCALTITARIKVDIHTGNELYEDTNSTYTVEKHNIIPTLYYDTQVREWCWRINDAQTRISAQGLKGQDGTNATCVVCKGVLQSTNGTPYVVKLTDVLTSTGFVSDISDLSNGQLAIVWYEDNTAGNGNWNCAFGSVDYNGSVPRVYVGHHVQNAATNINTDLLTAIGNTKLRREMNDICNTENTPTATDGSDVACRGLWVPNRFSQAPSSTNVHMIWSDNDALKKVVHFGVLPYSNTMASVETPPSTHTSTPNENEEEAFEFHYDKVRKDFIEAGRRFTLGPCNYTISTPEAHASNRESPKVTSSSASNVPSSIDQYINVRSSDNSNASINAITSKGIISKGIGDEKIFTIFIGTKMITMNSSMSIGSTSITITGTSRPNSLLCPLTNDDAQQNFIDSEKVLINNENLFVMNGSLLVGGEKAGMQAINAYVQHYNNSTIYNYDYLDVLREGIPAIIGASDKNFWSLSRPRKLDFVPVAIGGYLTMYNSKTSNRTSDGVSYNIFKTNPVYISKDENYKHTFLSGKMGWTGVIEQTGLTSLNNISNINELNAIKTFEEVDLQDQTDTRFGVATSMSGIWTKIGNVVDVKGKIFFTGVKIVLASNGKASVDRTYQLTYGELYSFLHKNAGYIKFPLPVVMQEGNNTYVSTGNVMYVPEGTMLYDGIFKNDTFDLHFGTETTRRFPNMYSSNAISPNDILNGEAMFHFYGKCLRTKKVSTFTQPWSGEETESGSGTTPQLLSFEVTTPIESSPNVFTCTAGLRLSSDKQNWEISNIPTDEMIDKVDTGTSDEKEKGRYGDGVGPVRFSFGAAANASSYNQTHKYDIVRPLVKARPVEDSTVWSTQMSNYRLFAVTTIAAYPVRCMTFQFSYLLDDDIYGMTPAYNRDGSRSQTWDTENWNLMTNVAANAIDVRSDIIDSAVRYSSYSDTWNTTTTSEVSERIIDVSRSEIADIDKVTAVESVEK